MPQTTERALPSTLFMQRLPEVLRSHLPEPLQGFKWRARSWLVQIYYGDLAFHYEVWALPGGKRMELGLHFESSTRRYNDDLLNAFGERLIEIKAELGGGVEAEPWDKGWSKVYETMPRETFSHEFLGRVAMRLARIIEVLEPMLRSALSMLPATVGGGDPDDGQDTA